MEPDELPVDLGLEAGELPVVFALLDPVSLAFADPAVTTTGRNDTSVPVAVVVVNAGMLLPIKKSPDADNVQSAWVVPMSLQLTDSTLTNREIQSSL